MYVNDKKETMEDIRKTNRTSTGEYVRIKLLETLWAQFPSEILSSVQAPILKIYEGTHCRFKSKEKSTKLKKVQ